MRDRVSLKIMLLFGLLSLSFLAYFSYFLPLDKALGDTPPFTMWNENPLNTTTTRYTSSFFYGHLGDGTGTINDDVTIHDSVRIKNLDDTRSMTLRMSGKIQGQEGWFAFSENPVVVAPNETKTLFFSITIPDGVCTDLYQAYLIANLEDYDGMSVSGGMNVSASIATEVFFNIDSGVPCLGGEVLPGLGDPPAYVPNPTFNGTVPVYTSGGGGGGGTTNEIICDDGIDNDNDGLIDCDDATNCAANNHCIPEADCEDGIDNDTDGNIDCADSDCSSDPVCDVLLIELVCDNGVDDDGDGNIDCLDSDCEFEAVCLPETICDDEVDNDGDGFIDCADSDCSEELICEGILPVSIESICDDELDDDSDGFIDCDDSDCLFDPVCIDEPVLTEMYCANGIDDDADGDIDCDDSDCAAYSACLPESICDDELDNDSDGNIDCMDSDCLLDPACQIFGLFNVKALPEKRVPKALGNFMTQGRLDFYAISGGTYSLEVPTSSEGIASIENTEVVPGWYKTSFKGLSHLTKYLGTNLQIKDGVDYDLDFSFADTFYLKAGDVALSKDDFVNSMDISATVKSLYKSDAHADLNLDGVVNALDLSIEFFNLYEAGDVLSSQ